MALTSLNGTENKYQQLIHQTWNHLVNFKIVLLQLFVGQNLQKLKKMVTPLSLDFHAPHVLRQIPEIPWGEMRPWWPTGFPPSQLPPLTEQSEGNIIYLHEVFWPDVPIFLPKCHPTNSILTTSDRNFHFLATDVSHRTTLKQKTLQEEGVL